MGWRANVTGKLGQHGGQLVRRCAQGEEPMLSVLGLHRGSGRGVCRALVLKWMCERARGRDFWDWLTPGGRLSVAAVANVAVQHVDVGKAGVGETTVQGVREQNIRPGRGVREDLSGDPAGGAQYPRFYGGLATTAQLFAVGAATRAVAVADGGVPKALGRAVRDEGPPGPALLYAGIRADAVTGHALGVHPHRVPRRPHRHLGRGVRVVRTRRRDRRVPGDDERPGAAGGREADRPAHDPGRGEGLAPVERGCV